MGKHEKKAVEAVAHFAESILIDGGGDDVVKGAVQWIAGATEVIRQRRDTAAKGFLDEIGYRLRSGEEPARVLAWLDSLDDSQLRAELMRRGGAA